MVNAVPNIPRVFLSSLKKDTKTATKDIIQVNEEAVPIEEMEALLFENLGGQEIINISRHDLINGRNLSYNPISNISSISRQYNSSNIISIHDTSPNIFNSFSIKLDRHLPEASAIYVDGVTGDLTIDVIDLLVGDQIEVQVLRSGQEEDLGV
jgi:hypothetical protein